MSNANNEKMIHLGAKIPAELSSRIDALAPYFKGGKSEIVRRAIAEGIQIVQGSHFVNFPLKRKP